MKDDEGKESNTQLYDVNLSIRAGHHLRFLYAHARNTRFLVGIKNLTTDKSVFISQQESLVIIEKIKDTLTTDAMIKLNLILLTIVFILNVSEYPYLWPLYFVSFYFLKTVNKRKQKKNAKLGSELHELIKSQIYPAINN